MRTLRIDIETYSDVDIKLGVHKYTESLNFEILLFAYQYDNEPVQIIDAYSDGLPDQIIQDLQNPDVLKTAYNAQFERVCLSKHLDIPLHPSQWYCTKAHAMAFNLPTSLEKCAEYLKLDNLKDPAGKALINFFSIPSRNKRNLPEDNQEKWEMFKQYCMQDVRTEASIAKYLEQLSLTETEKTLYIVDQLINDRGVLIDDEFLQSALQVINENDEKQLSRFTELTGLTTQNSTKQIKQWLSDNGVSVDNVTQDTLKQLIATDIPEHVKEALQIRLDLSKASIKKYQTMNDAKCDDNRLRGLMQLYGATQTGRWSGKVVQVQNLARNSITGLKEAREWVKVKDLELVEAFYGSPNELLKQLIRTAIIPEKNHKLLISDFSAIEARVLSWLAGEQWRLDVFKSHGKIYEASASKMFNTPIEDVTKELRQKGKIAELALGYGGSVNALTQMGALQMGLTEDELQPIVNAWRQSNANIVSFWYDLERSAINTVTSNTTVTFNRLKLKHIQGKLLIQLPSKRVLMYHDVQLENNQLKTANKCLYGGLLTENVVQAIARDILAEALIRLHRNDYKILFHVHDEIIVEANDKTIDEMNKLIEIAPDWADDLPLKTDGFEAEFYQKD